jgi:hypothetical protein
MGNDDLRKAYNEGIERGKQKFDDIWNGPDNLGTKDKRSHTMIAQLTEAQRKEKDPIKGQYWHAYLYQFRLMYSDKKQSIPADEWRKRWK